MAIKIEMLRSFCTVAEAGNLADAAERLGRTQSAVSMTLKQLEAHLSCALFESDRKNKLTVMGQQVFQLGQSQIRNFDSMVQSIELMSRAPQGIIRVAAVPSVAAPLFPNLVQALYTQYPGLQVELRDSDTQQVVDALSGGWADIGVASVFHAINGVTTEPLFTDPFGLVVGRTHPLASSADPIGIRDVFDVEFLRNALCDQIQNPLFQECLSKVSLTVHNTQSLLAMLSAGNWATVLPRSVINLAPENIVFRQISGLEDVRQVHLFMREACAFPEIAGSAKDLIRKSLLAG